MDAASTSESAVAAASATAAQTLATLGADRERGVSSDEAAARLRNDGANEVPEKTRHPVLPFLRHFWGLSA